MKNRNISDNLFWFTEKYLPYILGVLGALFMGWCSLGGKINNNNSLEKILDSTITFSSITVGFVGALLGILFSIRNTEIIDLLFESREKDTLKKYFRQNIVSGIILVVVSMTLYVKDGIDNIIAINIEKLKPSSIFFIMWGFLLFYMLASTYRITSIMMHIIFSDGKVENKEPEPVIMDEDSKKKLKEQYKK